MDIRSKKGFTLVEMIVVLSIVSVLIMLGFGSYSSLSRRARDTKREADLNDFINAINAFQLNERRGPNEGGLCESSIGASGDPCPINPPQNGWARPSGVWTDLVDGGYLKELPTDPINNQVYYYYYKPNNPSPNTGGWIRARLESSYGYIFKSWDAP